MAQPGATTVPAHILYDIVRKLPMASSVAGTTGEQGQLALKSGRSRFTLQTLPDSDFPDITAGDMPISFTMRLGAWATDRQDAVRDLDRRDPLLSSTASISTRSRSRVRRGCAQLRPIGIGWHCVETAAPQGSAGCGHHRAAQGCRGDPEAARDRRQRGHGRSLDHQDPRDIRRDRACVEVDRRHIPRLSSASFRPETTRC